MPRASPQRMTIRVGRTTVLTTVAKTNRHIIDWLKLHSVRNQVGVMGMACYSREHETEAHTLSLALGDRALVLDMTRIRCLPKRLTRAIRRRKVSAADVRATVRKLSFIRNPRFPHIRGVRGRVAPGMSRAPACRRRRVITREAIWVATVEAYGCYRRANRG